MTSTDQRIRGWEPLPAVHCCELCGMPVKWDDAQVSQWGVNFWHTACFNAEREAKA